MKNFNGKTPLDLAKGKASMDTLIRSAIAIYAEAKERIRLEREEVERQRLEVEQYETSPLILKIRRKLQKGNFDTFEGALYDEFKSLNEMQSFMADMTEKGRQTFCSKLVQKLGLLNARTEAKILDFLEVLIEELVSSPPSSTASASISVFSPGYCCR